MLSTCVMEGALQSPLLLASRLESPAGNVLGTAAGNASDKLSSADLGAPRQAALCPGARSRGGKARVDSPGGISEKSSAGLTRKDNFK